MARGRTQCIRLTSSSLILSQQLSSHTPRCPTLCSAATHTRLTHTHPRDTRTVASTVKYAHKSVRCLTWRGRALSNAGLAAASNTLHRLADHHCPDDDNTPSRYSPAHSFTASCHACPALRIARKHWHRDTRSDGTQQAPAATTTLTSALPPRSCPKTLQR